MLVLSLSVTSVMAASLDASKLAINAHATALWRVLLQSTSRRVGSVPRKDSASCAARMRRSQAAQSCVVSVVLRVSLARVTTPSPKGCADRP